MSLVFFDFDGTLTKRDTILPFGFWLARSKSKTRFRMAALLFLMGLLKFRFLSNHQFKEKFCRLLLKGESEKRVDELSLAFLANYVERSLNSSVVSVLLEHQEKGDVVYLVSSNFTFLLRPLQTRWNSSGVIATDLEVEAGRFTGQIHGRACDGAEKLARVIELFGKDLVKEATAYGDSRGDRPLLDFVKTAVWV